MYLARRVIDNRLHYLLRESYLDGDVYRNRDLLELGSDPAGYIVYPGGSSFYIDDRIFDRLKKNGIDADYDEVESFFLPFLDPYIRSRIDPFFEPDLSSRLEEDGPGDTKTGHRVHPCI